MKNEEILEMNNDNFHGSSMNNAHFHGSSMNNEHVRGSSMNNDNFHGSSMNNDHFHGSSMNNGKKFDIILSNPPYGHTGSNTIHLQFVEKCLELSDKQIAIFPYTFVTKKNNKSNNKFKEKFSKYLKSIEEVDSKLFIGTAMPNTAIYLFDNKENNNIEIIPINGKSYNIESLLSLSNFSDYENEIIKYLKEQGSQDILGDCGRLNNWKAQVQGLNDKTEKLTELVNHSLKNLKKYYENHKNYYGLTINNANGGMNGSALSSKNGQIFNNYDDFVKLFVDRPLGIGYNILMFKSKTEAENCKEALKRPLLRFTLYRMQDDQRMTRRNYKYVPSIDWEDDRVKTDEGLLEVCGCPKDKAKEYAEYCKKIIAEVDKK